MVSYNYGGLIERILMVKEIEAECPKCYKIFDFDTDDFSEVDGGPDIDDVVQLICPHCDYSFTK